MKHAKFYINSKEQALKPHPRNVNSLGMKEYITSRRRDGKRYNILRLASTPSIIFSIANFIHVLLFGITLEIQCLLIFTYLKKTQ